MSAGHGSKQDRRREQAIAALMTYGTVEQAAKKAKVGYRTLKTWLSDPAFQAQYREARKDFLERTTARLLGLCDRAVEALERNLTAAKASDQIRAAVAVLVQTVKGVDSLDLSERVAS
jgi:hypothetical protein